MVIPLDAVSGEHARLEREGSRVFLVDLGSTNGTALNDPTNKIKRAVLKPTDAVFLGTHRVLGADLLAALPEIPSEETALERERPEELAQQQAAPGEGVASAASPLAGNTPAAWGLGVGISVVCAALIVAGARSCRQPPFATSAADSSKQSGEATKTAPPIERANATPAAHPTAATQREPDEALVRKSADGVFMIGLRTEQHLALSDVSAWACGLHSVICPTAILDMIAELRKEWGGSQRSCRRLRSQGNIGDRGTQGGEWAGRGFFPRPGRGPFKPRLPGGHGARRDCLRAGAAAGHAFDLGR